MSDIAPAGYDSELERNMNSALGLVEVYTVQNVDSHDSGEGISRSMVDGRPDQLAQVPL